MLASLGSKKIDVGAYEYITQWAIIHDRYNSYDDLCIMLSKVPTLPIYFFNADLKVSCSNCDANVYFLERYKKLSK